MNVIDISVILGSIIASILILYYFFGPKGEAVSAQQNTHHQRAVVVVEGGFSPSEIKLKADVLAEIIFDRRDKGECNEWVIFDRFPTKEGVEIKARLPEGKKTTVSFTPLSVGKYSFSCGMGMNKGKLIVKA